MKTMFVVAALAALLVGASASAHHSAAMFDKQHKRTLTGTVREFQWANPHCYVQLLVANDKSRKEDWSLEMGAPPYLYNNGWRRSTLKAGDRITVTIAPLLNGDNGGLLLKATTVDGKPLGAAK